MTNKNQDPATIPVPEAHYRCEGVDFGAQALAEIHFHDPNGGFLPPNELFHATLFEKSSNTECSGFFCTLCLQAFNLTRARKKSLKDAINARIEQAQQNTVKELIKGLMPYT